jgi:hypothetical protein
VRRGPAKRGIAKRLDPHAHRRCAGDSYIIIEEAGPGEPLETLGVVLNYAVWTAFVVEAAVMICVVPNKWQWVRQHPIEAAIDASLPFVSPPGGSTSAPSPAPTIAATGPSC